MKNQTDDLEVCFCDIGDFSWGLTQAKSVLCHRVTSSAPEYLSCTSQTGKARKEQLGIDVESFANCFFGLRIKRLNFLYQAS